MDTTCHLLSGSVEVRTVKQDSFKSAIIGFVNQWWHTSTMQVLQMRPFFQKHLLLENAFVLDFVLGRQNCTWN